MFRFSDVVWLAAVAVFAAVCQGTDVIPIGLLAGSR